MNDVRLLARMAPGIARVSFNDDVAMWCRVRVRKAHDCCVCEQTLPKSVQMFAPVGNQLYRYRRICMTCIDDLTRDLRPIC